MLLNNAHFVGYKNILDLFVSKHFQKTSSAITGLLGYTLYSIYLLYSILYILLGYTWYSPLSTVEI